MTVNRVKRIGKTGAYNTIGMFYAEVFAQMDQNGHRSRAITKTFQKEEIEKFTDLSENLLGPVNEDTYASIKKLIDFDFLSRRSYSRWNPIRGGICYYRILEITDEGIFIVELE